ncbi:hypothetical protein PS900_01879 [Pseudomonas fluorescens]|uniref:Uncharacterized protein n=1 Tax=Pseudomonas fluorescens TaxID=294 RepID=A0A8H2NQ30_PSEFL|nr:hypothetical protein PS900_01879 [Pseudomonas fluorescens]
MLITFGVRRHVSLKSLEYPTTNGMPGSKGSNGGENETWGVKEGASRLGGGYAVTEERPAEN